MISRHITIAVTLFAISASAVPTAVMAGCVPSVKGDGQENTCVGTRALAKNSTGTGNTATGYEALSNNTTGPNNTAIGNGALSANTIGEANTAVGLTALSSNTSGDKNTAIGDAALFSNTNGTYNVATGAGALLTNTTGSNNSANGTSALTLNTTGYNNTANGNQALYYNTTGFYNTAIGDSALWNNISGSYNIALGYNAGSVSTIGSYNIFIGNGGEIKDSKTIRIGKQGEQTRTFVAGIRSKNVTGGQAVVINADGQLGIVSSSRRYKDDILPMGNASDALMQLRPVTFHYKEAEADGSKPLQYGLIAEEVNDVMPDLVVRNEDGAPESVAYHILPTLLLNEYQKQQRELIATKAKLAETSDKLVAATDKLVATDDKVVAMLDELSALKRVIARLANAPIIVRAATNAP